MVRDAYPKPFLFLVIFDLKHNICIASGVYGIKYARGKV
jgi:hypothetical protein